MSDNVILEIVKTTGIIATAILSTIAIIWQSRAQKKQKDMDIRIDGRLTQLLEEKTKSSLLEGHAAGVKDQKAETAQGPIVAELKIPELKVTMTPPPPTPPTPPPPTPPPPTSTPSKK